MPQVPLAEHHHMIETFPTDRADQPLRIAILPRQRANAEGTNHLANRLP